MANPFTEQITWRRTAPQRFTGAFSPDWSVNGGVFGGMVAAVVLRQMERTLDVPAQLPRSLQVHLGAVTFGVAEVSAIVFHHGARVSHVSAQVEQQGKTVAMATATFGAALAAPTSICAAEAPSVPEPSEVSTVPFLKTLLGPRIADCFDIRPVLGEQIFSGARVPRSGGWIDLRAPLEDGPALAAFLLDAWFPAALTAYEQYDPSRRTLTVDIRCDFAGATQRRGLTQDAFLIEVSSDVTSDGYAVEDGVLWDQTCTLLARVRQRYAIID